jgi:hypothetical protein
MTDPLKNLDKTVFHPPGENSGSLRIDTLAALVAREVAGVQREDPADAVRFHRCDEPRIVYLNAKDIVRGDELSPRAIRQSGIW